MLGRLLRKDESVIKNKIAFSSLNFWEEESVLNANWCWIINVKYDNLFLICVRIHDVSGKHKRFKKKLWLQHFLYFIWPQISELWLKFVWCQSNFDHYYARRFSKKFFTASLLFKVSWDYVKKISFRSSCNVWKFSEKSETRRSKLWIQKSSNKNMKKISFLGKHKIISQSWCTKFLLEVHKFWFRKIFTGNLRKTLATQPDK